MARRWWGLTARSFRSSWGSPRRIAPRLGRLSCAAGWLLAGLLGCSVAYAGEGVVPARPEFDRTVLDSELSRPLAEVRQQGPEALRSHLGHLTEIYAALDETDTVPEAERRALRDRILVRVAQIGLQTRDEGSSASRNANARNGWSTAAGSSGALGGTLGVLGERSVQTVGVLGVLIVAYSLGRLAGYRRGASQASYYGAGDPRLWFVERSRETTRPAAPVVRITLDQIQATLAAGRTVLLQLGYEISPRRREEFLGLIREMGLALNDLGDRVYSAWEDPRHPNRFYEVVVCRSMETMELLTSARSELAGLDARIEACWRSGRPVMRRAWWSIFPERDEVESGLALSASSGRARGEPAP
jgi:hypothetical protein